MPYIEKSGNNNYVALTPFDIAITSLKHLSRKLDISLRKFEFAIFDKQTEQEVIHHSQAFILKYVNTDMVSIDGKNQVSVTSIIPKELYNLLKIPVTASFDYAHSRLTINSPFLQRIDEYEDAFLLEYRRLNKIVEDEEIAKLPYNIYYDYHNFHGEQFIKSDEDLNEMITAMKMLREEINDNCCDNFRCFPIEMNDAYNCIRSRGCCGFADGVFKCSSGNSYNYGFNYGH